MPADTTARKLAKQRQKAFVLGALTLVMALFMLRAYLQMSPKPAAASNALADNAAAALPAATAPVNAVARLNLSRDLWKTLRAVRGAAPAAVFKFDPALYPPDPLRPRAIVTETPQDTTPRAPQLPVYDEEAARKAHFAAVHDQARNLIVRSTVVNTGAHPVAVVNDRILTLGDHINGFEVTAIRAREVDFTKEQVICTEKMVDMPRGQ